MRFTSAMLLRQRQSDGLSVPLELLACTVPLG